MTAAELDPLLAPLRLIRELGSAVDARTASEVLKTAPVLVRAVLTSAIMAGADRPLNQASLAEAAGYSRGTAYRTNRAELEVVLEVMPALAAAVLGAARSGRSVSELTSELHRRDSKIAELRMALAASEHERGVVLSYARDLHQQLEPEYRANLNDRREKVRHLRPVETPDPSQPSSS